MPLYRPKTTSLLPFLTLAIFALLLPTRTLAQIPPASEDAPVSATVPDFTGDTTPPTAPILIAPPNHALVSTSYPTYIFKRSTDTSSIVYFLHINESLAFSDIPDNANKVTATYSSQVSSDSIIITPTQPLPDGTYTWRVIARDGLGNTASSVTWTFTIDTAPSPPVLVSPADESFINDPSPTYIFKHSTDSTAITYNLYLNGTTTFIDILDSDNKLTSNYTSLVFSDNIQVTPLYDLPDGTYTWQVIAKDANGNTASSATWTFTIDTTPPPITVTQINGHEDLYLSTLDPDSITDDTEFVIPPGNTLISITTDPYTVVHINVTHNGTTTSFVETSDSTGLIQLSINFEVGEHLFSAFATDQSGNTSSLEVFTITALEELIPPFSFLRVPFLTATISEISLSRDIPADLIIGLIALAILILILLLWKRYNVFVYDIINGDELEGVSIFHSLPEKELSSTKTDKRGRAIVKHIQYQSTLSFELEDKSLVMSIIKPQRKYIIKL